MEQQIKELLEKIRSMEGALSNDTHNIKSLDNLTGMADLNFEFQILLKTVSNMIALEIINSIYVKYQLSIFEVEKVKEALIVNARKLAKS